MTHAVTRQEYDERLKRGWRENGAIRAKGKAHRHLGAPHPGQGRDGADPGRGRPLGPATPRPGRRCPQVRDAIRVVFPEAVTLVREAREGLS